MTLFLILEEFYGVNKGENNFESILPSSKYCIVLFWKVEVEFFETAPVSKNLCIKTCSILMHLFPSFIIINFKKLISQENVLNLLYLARTPCLISYCNCNIC